MDRFSKIDSSIDLRYKTERLAFTNKQAHVNTAAFYTYGLFYRARDLE